MNIFDLNHIEAVEGNEAVGGGYSYNNIDFKSDVYKDRDEYLNIIANIKKNVKIDVDVNGWVAEGQAVSTAKGPNALATQFTATDAAPGYATGVAESGSYVNY